MRRGIGGSRGGGSRGGSSSRSSGRSYRSSRRHHYHRHHYHRGYYGRRGYYGGGGSIVGLIIFMMIFFGTIALVISFVIVTPSNYEFGLQEGTTRGISYNKFWDGDVDIEATNGDITTYLFDNEPDLSDSRSFTFSDIAIIPAGEYQPWDLYLTSGSDITTSWTADSSVNYFIIRGDNDFDSWKEGDDTQLYSTSGSVGTHDYTVAESDNYYFVFENRGNLQNTVSVDFDYTLKIHDISNSLEFFEGSVEIDASEMEGRYIVIKNTGTGVASVIVIIDSNFSFGTIFLVMMVAIIGVTVLISKKIKSSKKKSGGNPPSRGTSMVPNNQELDRSNYYTRPDPQYCRSCGSNILPSSKYCSECGVSL